MNDASLKLTSDDLFDDTSFRTPPIDSLKNKGTNKSLVVIFVVDCSRSMDGDRIMAVNAALSEIKSILQEFKNQHGLDVKMSIMTFTSSVRWELELTDVDEVSLPDLKTRAGLTGYGNAFHELNNVLTKEKYMKHTGKIAPPAIMFLTDGGPTDDYAHDLDVLLKNGWFMNATRCAVLLGDAIYSNDAKSAVSRFVKDPDKEIVDADNSAIIIQSIKLATLHTVAGNPIDKGNTYTDIDGVSSAPALNDDPFKDTSNLPVSDPSQNIPFVGDVIDDSYFPFDQDQDLQEDGQIGDYTDISNNLNVQTDSTNDSVFDTYSNNIFRDNGIDDHFDDIGDGRSIDKFVKDNVDSVNLFSDNDGLGENPLGNTDSFDLDSDPFSGDGDSLSPFDSDDEFSF